MLTQDLPPSATSYDRAQRRESREAVRAVKRQWRRMGHDFDTGWTRIAPSVAAIVSTAQRRVATRAGVYIPAVLEDTGQTRAIPALAATNTEALVGVTGAGYAVMDSLSVATIRAKQDVAGGASEFLALQRAGKWLSYSVGTILSDTSRTAEAVGIYTRHVDKYVRMLTPPSCGRCVILAGREYRSSVAFERHPGCDCRHIPASEAVAGDLRVDPQAYFDSLDEAGQAKLMGSIGNAKAVREGADMGQIINAYHKTAAAQVFGISPIQSMKMGSRTAKFTDAGTTRHGSAYKAMRKHGAVKAGSQVVRIMPETIYRYAKNRDDALRLLKTYGWIL